jgi:Zn ribbon nucleic-acid-binding protein
MAKGKLATPDWILEGYDSKADYEKAKGLASKKKSGKTFKIRECPKCKSDDVVVLLTGEEGKGSRGWECKKCGWQGHNVQEKELTEDELMEYLDSKGEDVA